MTNENKELAKAEQAASERFVNMVLSEIGTGDVQITDRHKRLAQGYMLGISKALQDANITWADAIIDNTLAQSIVSYAKIGLDMSVKNHLFVIPRKSGKHPGKYTLTFQQGYKGRELIARKYSYDEIVDISSDLIYSNDTFKPHKKDANHDHDTYEFEITNPFDRGNIVGGFAYMQYADEKKNKLFMLSKAQIDKRKNVAMSKAFWDKWPDEMALKTVINYACEKAQIDPDKIDEDFMRVLESEREAEEAELAADVSENANGNVIDVETSEPDEPKQIENQPIKQPVVEMPTVNEPAPVEVKVTNQTEPDLGF